jgi:hypothetical protein
MNPLLDLLMQISQGNPGALNVLMQVMDSNPITALVVFSFLKENGLTGSTVWLLYKDWQKQNVDNFIDKIVNHPEEVLAYVNSNVDIQYYMNQA